MHSELERPVISADPLWASVPLPLHRTFFPLGFPLRLSTNSELVLQAAEESWGINTQMFDCEPVYTSIGVSQSKAPAAAPPAFRSRQHMLSIISDAENFALCDLRSGYSWGWITEETASDLSFLRFYFLDASVLTLIEQRYLAPIHAALVSKGNTGVLLCGDTGAGKSTLAYGCARSGWKFVSDDGTFLLRNEKTLTAIGNCAAIRLKADAPRLFPELLDWQASVRANGKLGFELCTTELPQPLETSPQAVITDVVFLDRSPVNREQLLPMAVEDPLGNLGREVWYGDEEVQAAQRLTYLRLAETRWWTLRYGEYERAVSLLDSLVSRNRGFE